MLYKNIQESMYCDDLGDDKLEILSIGARYVEIQFTLD